MATKCEPSSYSPGNILSLTVDEPEMSNRQQSLMEIRRWIETEAGFYGRSDEDFLLLFLQSCEFDMKLTKMTLIRYYECRRNVPQWWANRNVKDDNTLSILKLKSTIALIEGHIHQPTVIITTNSRFSENLNNLDDYMKVAMMTLEMVIRRSNSQRNGTVWIVDFKNYKKWMMWDFLNPVYGKTFIDCCFYAFPVRMKSIIAINVPMIAASISKLINPFLPPSVKGRLHIYGSDWSSKIGEHLPLEVLPEEYGGCTGPMEQHEDAFLEELLAFNDYMVDDNKYGFQ